MSAEADADRPGLLDAARTRKILLVYPEFPRTYWALQYGLAIAGRRATMPPLALITVAASLPRDWSIRLVDMNIEEDVLPRLRRALDDVRAERSIHSGQAHRSARSVTAP